MEQKTAQAHERSTHVLKNQYGRILQLVPNNMDFS